MKKPIAVNVSARFEAEAIQVLRQIPELEVSDGADLLTPGRDALCDAWVQYGDISTPVAIEFKTRVNSATAHLMAQQAKLLEKPLVVIASEMTGASQRILHEAGIGWVDGLGSVRLQLPGILVRISGTKRARSVPPSRLSGKSGVIAQALLLGVDRSWRVSDLAERCEASPGLVHRVLKRLEGESVVAAQGRGPNKTRRVSNPTALLDLWSEEHRDNATRQPAFVLAQTHDQLMESLRADLETAQVDYALTGAAAASHCAPFITHVAVIETWLDGRADVNEVCRRLGATRVESGPNMVFLQESRDLPLAFRARNKGLWTTNVFRLYVDLRRDPRRGHEQSDHFRREVIGF